MTVLIRKDSFSIVVTAAQCWSRFWGSVMIARLGRACVLSNFWYRRSCLTCWSRLPIFLMSVSVVWASTPVRSDKISTATAVFVIVDGVPADVVELVSTPELDLIYMSGGYARSSVGGPIGEPGKTPTISTPGYVSLLTDTWSNKHNVRINYQLSPNHDYWNIFWHLKYLHPPLRIVFFQLGQIIGRFFWAKDCERRRS